MREGKGNIRICIFAIRYGDESSEKLFKPFGS